MIRPFGEYVTITPIKEMSTSSGLLLQDDLGDIQQYGILEGCGHKVPKEINEMIGSKVLFDRTSAFTGANGYQEIDGKLIISFRALKLGFIN